MCDKELLVGYLYDELDGTARQAFEAHLRACPECEAEVGGLQATRGHIAAWAPPERDLELRVVRGRSAAPPARAWAMPAWGLAAAATLVLAASAALANIEVRYDDGGVTVRTGWGRAAAPAVSADAEPAATPGEAIDVVALNQRLSQLEAALARAPQAAPASAAARMSDAELLRRVRELIGEAETRQQREVALVLAQVL
jgi:anti-sigma factor RsiW